MPQAVGSRALPQGPRGSLPLGAWGPEQAAAVRRAPEQDGDLSAAPDALSQGPWQTSKFCSLGRRWREWLAPTSPSPCGPPVWPPGAPPADGRPHRPAGLGVGRACGQRLPCAPGWFSAVSRVRVDFYDRSVVFGSPKGSRTCNYGPGVCGSDSSPGSFGGAGAARQQHGLRSTQVPPGKADGARSLLLSCSCSEDPPSAEKVI